jgi:hypothetical protein
MEQILLRVEWQDKKLSFRKKLKSLGKDYGDNILRLILICLKMLLTKTYGKKFNIQVKKIHKFIVKYLDVIQIMK